MCLLVIKGAKLLLAPFEAEPLKEKNRTGKGNTLARNSFLVPGGTYSLFAYRILVLLWASLLFLVIILYFTVLFYNID